MVPAFSIAVLAAGPALALAKEAGPVGLVGKPYITKTGSFGIFAVLSAVTQENGFVLEKDGAQWRSRERFNPAGGFGLLGEAFVSHGVALGAECVIVFPEPSEYASRYQSAHSNDWNDWTYSHDCGNCKANVLFTLAFRVRKLISINPWVRLYPLLALGIGTSTARFSDFAGVRVDDITYFGLAYSAALGIEVSTRYPITVFSELRYFGGFTTRTDGPSSARYDTILLNSLAFALAGARFY